MSYSPAIFTAAMKKMTSPHDALFKTFLGDITIARDFLELHMPAHLRERCDFSTLAMEPGSFIEDDMRPLSTDMLYSLQTGAGKGYIYCVIEHQSRPDKRMGFRLMRYSIAAMNQHLKQGGKTLPLIVPLLFYHGETSPYPYSTRWLDCFDDPHLAELVYSQPFPLVDVTAMPDEHILTHRRVAVLELAQKHIRTRDMLEISQAIGNLLNAWHLELDVVRTLLQYIFSRVILRNQAAF